MVPDHATCIAFINRVMMSSYELNAEGPDKFDCYTLTKLAQWELFGRELPQIKLKDESPKTLMEAIREGRQTTKWVQTTVPIHGCIVEMSHAKIPHHIGTWLAINGGGVLHTTPKTGVSFDNPFQLKILGWRRFVYDVPAN